MTFEQLRVFVAVAEREHITRASEFLNLTQSAVSSAIAALESDFGLKFFNRIGRGISLTEAGKVFLVEAHAILARAESTRSAMAEFSGLTRGRLVIQASQTIASYFLPGYLVSFHIKYPGIQLAVSIGNTAQVVNAVINGDAELGFVEGPVNEARLSVEPVGTDQMIIVVAPDHPWGMKSSLTTKDLAEGNWILREDGSGTRAVFTEAMARFGVDPATLQVRISLPSNEAVCRAVEQGAGATALSALVCSESIAAGRLVRVNADLLPRDLSAVQHMDHYQSRSVTTLLNMIRAGTSRERTK